MDNPLVQKIETELDHIGLRGAELLHEHYNEQAFGNASAVYKAGNLYLNFVRDRGDDTIDFLNPADETELYTFDDMSLVMGWESLDQMLKEVEKARRDLSQPPLGPIPLSDAILLIKKHFEQLQLMFSSSELDATIAKLQDASKKRCKAFLG